MVIDDWAIAPMTEPERQDFQDARTISLRSISADALYDQSMAPRQIRRSDVDDGILDQLVHNAHKIEMKGRSMQQEGGKKP
jgi:DNA replication protein DnaC